MPVYVCLSNIDFYNFLHSFITYTVHLFGMI
jgi:hypothetical protein